MTATATITATEQFLRELLTCAVEGGINHWARVEQTNRAGGQVTSAHIYIYEDGEHHVIDTQTVAKGITETLRPGLDRQVRKALATMGREGDYDAGDAAEVVQRGLFGDVIFA